MSSTMLSIIIPCYNCETTLREAVDSCYKQGIEENDFEIVLVDDASTDGTHTIMQGLEHHHTNIKCISHATNMGGGAARNTAVRNASGDIIFCLDSDDILPEAVLPQMIKLLRESNCDGVLFEETRFFNKHPGYNEQIVKNTNLHRPVFLTDMFDSEVGFTARVNFLYTKKSYVQCGGYPEHHGFDTQTFGFRFLSSGLKVLICHGTYYYHRRHAGTSYFDRESQSGRLSFNAYLMYEDIFHLFSTPIKEGIINFPIFKNNILGVDNLEMCLMSEFNRRKENDFFIKDYRAFLKKNGRDEYMKNSIRSTAPSTQFTHAIILHSKKEYIDSISLYKELVIYYPTSTVLKLNIQRSVVAQEGIIALNLIEKTIYQSVYKHEKNTLIKVLIGKIWRKITRNIAKIKKR